MYNGDITYENPQDIVDAFGKLFSNMFLPGESESRDDVSASFSGPCFNLQLVSEDKVIEIMSTFSCKHTAGDDQIPSFLVHDARFALAKPLTFIINMAISKSIFPDRWKRARITPIFKKNEKKQHGFVPGRSAQTNLSVFTQFVCKVLDQRGQVDMVYTDLSSAFDLVDYSILLNKLDMFGVGSSFLALLHSCPYDRSVKNSKISIKVMEVRICSGSIHQTLHKIADYLE
ncbi:uncharacterized protein LOC135138527 [Zophobas morio]|uniref:uncharacterized protein LOC135138527 n=1 Tax=Zophobas morio TaxID=2755281 RepID=UPI003083913B